jgi:hypothetical protein
MPFCVRSASRAAESVASEIAARVPAYIHVDVKYLPQMADGEADQKTVRGTVFPPNARRYLFVAIDRATRLGSSSASSGPGPRPMRDASRATSNAPARSASASS